MRQAQVDLVIVGADRIAANGDFANKIGTYPLAVLALHHGVPFYCAAPRRSSLRRASVARSRSEEHTSELQSQSNLVCRLLLEKKHQAECAHERPVEATAHIGLPHLLPYAPYALHARYTTSLRAPSNTTFTTTSPAARTMSVWH